MRNGLVSAARWSVRWHQAGAHPDEHIVYENCMPVMFRTRAEARSWIEKKFGYIRQREDLRSFPYQWRIPTPIRVQVVENFPTAPNTERIEG